MPSLGRNEADFNLAIKTAQKAVQEAIAAIHNMGEIIAQVLKNIQESERKAKQALARGLTTNKGGPGTPLDFKPLAKNMDTQAKNISNKNEKLQKALGTLNLLGQASSPTTTRQIQNQLKKLDSTIQTTNKSNKALGSLMRAELMLSGKPQLGKGLMKKAVEKTNTVLRQSSNTVLQGLNAEQLHKVVRLNLHEGIRSGHHLQDQNKPQVLQTMRVFDRSLNELRIKNQQMLSLRVKSTDQQEVTPVQEKKKYPKPGQG